jgi:hypothetical protein
MHSSSQWASSSGVFLESAVGKQAFTLPRLTNPEMADSQIKTVYAKKNGILRGKKTRTNCSVFESFYLDGFE